MAKLGSEETADRIIRSRLVLDRAASSEIFRQVADRGSWFLDQIGRNRYIRLMAGRLDKRGTQISLPDREGARKAEGLAPGVIAQGGGVLERVPRRQDDERPNV